MCFGDTSLALAMSPRIFTAIRCVPFSGSEACVCLHNWFYITPLSLTRVYAFTSGSTSLRSHTLERISSLARAPSPTLPLSPQTLPHFRPSIDASICSVFWPSSPGFLPHEQPIPSRLVTPSSFCFFRHFLGSSLRTETFFFYSLHHAPMFACFAYHAEEQRSKSACHNS